MNARRFLGYAREETVSIRWALLNANAQQVTSRVKPLRSVKTSMSAASFLGYVRLASVPTPWEAIFAFVHVATSPQQMALGALVSLGFLKAQYSASL